MCLKTLASNMPINWQARMEGHGGRARRPRQEAGSERTGLWASTPPLGLFSINRHANDVYPHPWALPA